jgi:uncharacterized protein YggE
MKNFLLSFVFFLSFFTAFAQYTGARYVEVVGSGTVTLEADSAIIYITLEADNEKDVIDAEKRLKEYLTLNSIPLSALENTYDDYYTYYEGKKEFSTYVRDYALTVKDESFEDDLYNHFYDEAIFYVADYVDYVYNENEGVDELSLLEAAIADAKVKAEKIAKLLGANLGKVLYVVQGEDFSSTYTEEDYFYYEEIREQYKIRVAFELY